MNRLLLALLCATFALPTARADRTLAEASRARQMVGPERWAQIIRIENPRRLSGYPASFHALVFELETRLWLYVPGVGTQSLSLIAGHTEQDKTDLARLLQSADPAFQSYTLPAANDLLNAARADEPSAFTEGCFIHALAAWQTMLARGHIPETAGILVYYGTTARRGHAVLYYSLGGHHFVFDQARSPQPIALQMPPHPDPRALAQALVNPARTTSLLRAKLLRLHPTLPAAEAGITRTGES